MVRRPCVADQFYPGNPDTLRKMIEGFVEACEKEEVIGAISPHAGYIYSGRVAGILFSHILIPDNVLLLGPNHTGLGEMVSLYPEGHWETPLGEVEVNGDLSRLILERIPLVREDTLAHLREHSLEVQIPFLQYFNPSVRIVPITIMHMDLERCIEVGRALGDLLKDYGEKVLILISSDMNHYESQDVTISKDMEAIEEILRLDTRRLWRIVRERDISMCGIIPAVVGIEACRRLGAKEARLLKHMTSGEVSGDYGHVVGYAGIVIK